jgi:hypothetical protein
MKNSKPKKNPLVEYVNISRVPDSKIIYGKDGEIEGGSYRSSKATEVASNLYKGSHYYRSEKDESVEVWVLGKLALVFGLK